MGVQFFSLADQPQGVSLSAVKEALSRMRALHDKGIILYEGARMARKSGRRLIASFLRLFAWMYFLRARYEMGEAVSHHHYTEKYYNWFTREDWQTIRRLARMYRDNLTLGIAEAALRK